MKIKELKTLPFGIVGRVEVMHPAKVKGGFSYELFKGLDDAISQFGEMRVVQIFPCLEYKAGRDSESYLCIVAVEEV